MHPILTIAGSDCSGGAGIQADIKTIAAHKLYAMSVITSLTAQNSVGISAILDVPAPFVAAQLDSIFTDFEPRAVKIGMVSTVENIDVIVRKIEQYRPKNIVIDPVMLSTSGQKLLDDQAMDVLVHRLLPLATVITPNIAEAEVLAGMTIHNRSDMLVAAERIRRKIGTAVLIKGGHLHDDPADLLHENEDFQWHVSRRIDNPNNHGTGCTLSSAIACRLSSGWSLNDSVSSAKAYLTTILSSTLNLGEGCGPLDHSFTSANL